jgi:hypothetical protein
MLWRAVTEEFYMKKIVIILFVLSFFCNNSFSSENLINQLTFLSDISNERNLAILKIQNHSNDGIICNNLGFTAKLEDPRLYMQTGEIVITINNLFIYPESQNRLFEASFFHNELVTLNKKNPLRQIIIRETYLELNKTSCRVASFFDYCKYANKDQFEMLSMAALGMVFEKPSCYELNNKIFDDLWINLDNTLIADFRFTQYLPNLKKLKVSNTFYDRSGYLYDQSSFHVKGRSTQLTSYNNTDYNEYIHSFNIDDRNLLSSFIF